MTLDLRIQPLRPLLLTAAIATAFAASGLLLDDNYFSS